MERKELWFKAKRYGWGWYPSSWQGWAVLALYIFSLFSLFVFVDNHSNSVSDVLMTFLPQVFILTVFLIIICYKTGEAPGWRWGTLQDDVFDVLDDKGNKTGKTATRKMVHDKGLWHRAAHVYIMNSKGEILLQRRSARSSFRPGRWYISAGGHLLKGETSLPRAVKEVAGELGLIIPESRFEFVGTISKQNVLLYGTYVNHEFDDIYLVRDDAPIIHVKKRHGESVEVQWFPVEKFKEYIAGHDPSFVHYEGLPLLFAYLAKHPA